MIWFPTQNSFFSSLLGWPTYIQAFSFSQRLASWCFLNFQFWWGMVFFSKSPFYIIICRSPCMHWTKVRVFFHLFLIKESYYLSLLCSDRFFETEGIAVLAMLVSQYKIAIKEEPQFAGETFEEKKSRILSTRQIVTLTYVIFIFWIDERWNPIWSFFIITQACTYSSDFDSSLIRRSIHFTVEGVDWHLWLELLVLY